MSAATATLRGAAPLGVAAGVGALAAAAVGALAADAPAYGLLAAFALLAGVATLTRPDLATLLVVGVLYSNAAVLAYKFHGAPYAAAAGLPLVLLLPLLYHLLVRGERPVATRALPAVLALFVVQIAATIGARDGNATIVELLGFVVEGLGLYLLVTNVVRSLALLRRIVWLLLVVGALSGALSLFQQATGSFDNDYGGFAQVSQAEFRTGELRSGIEETQRRLAGPIGEQNRYAQILLVLIPLGLFTRWSERDPRRRLLAGACTALIAVGATLTFSRGAAVAFALVLVLMTLLRYIRVHQLLAVAAAVFLLLSLVPAYKARLATLGAVSGATAQPGSGTQADGSARSRATENLAAALVLRDNLALGVGPGQFPSYYEDYAQRVGIRVVEGNRQAHNLYLGLAAETGLAGLAFFLAAVGITLRELARARRRFLRRRPELAHLAAGFLFAVVAYMASGLFLHLSYQRYFWLLLALAGAAARLILLEAAPPPRAQHHPIGQDTPRPAAGVPARAERLA